MTRRERLEVRELAQHILKSKEETQVTLNTQEKTRNLTLKLHHASTPH